MGQKVGSELIRRPDTDFLDSFATYTYSRRIFPLKKGRDKDGTGRDRRYRGGDWKPRVKA